MSRRSALPLVLAAALVVVASVGGSSPAAHPGPDARTLDLLASAHPSAFRPTVSEAAYSATWARGPAVELDTAALTSATCDGCVGESTALHVLYVPRARRADLDNVATAWAQQCHGCTSTALSVQVVVLAGRPDAAPNNRALSLTAACDRCRTSALAFQVVLVADRATPLGPDELAGLQAWCDEQAAMLRASVATQASDLVTSLPTPSPAPTETPTTLTSEDPTEAPTTVPQPRRRPGTLRRDAVSALDELEVLLTSALPADVVSADVEVSR